MPDGPRNTQADAHQAARPTADWRMPKSFRRSRVSSLRRIEAARPGHAKTIAVLLISACLAGCGGQAATSGQQRLLTIAVGSQGGVSNDVAHALAASYEQGVSGLHVMLRFGRGVDDNLAALKDGVADVGFVDAEGAYVAYRQEISGQVTAHHVRAVAVLYPTAVHLFVRRSLNITSVEQLRGNAVIVGDRDDYADRAMQLILESYGLSYATVRPIFESGQPAVDAIRNGKAAAVVVYTPFRSRAILDLTAAGDLELVPLSHHNIGHIQSTTERNHFVKTITIPGGTYPGQSHDVLTMGDDILLVCRADLDEALVYALTKTLFESVPSLVRAHPAAASIDVERGPTTSVPLHPGAARYYRQHELPR